MKKHKIESGTDCFICGAEFWIHTNAEQEDRVDVRHYGEPYRADIRSYSWTAGDGDEVICDDCGAMGWVSADGETAYVSWDEMDEHNTKCYDAWEEKEKLDSVSRND